MKMLKGLSVQRNVNDVCTLRTRRTVTASVLDRFAKPRHSRNVRLYPSRALFMLSSLCPPQAAAAEERAAVSMQPLKGMQMTALRCSVTRPDAPGHVHGAQPAQHLHVASYGRLLTGRVFKRAAVGLSPL